MKLEDIFKEWDNDWDVNRAELGYAALDIPKIHTKYYRILIDEKLRLKSMQADHDVLMLDKTEFYSGNNTKRHHDMGWELPDRGMILKGDMPAFLSADKDVIESNFKIAHQQEKVKTVEAIIGMIKNRSYHISAAIAWEKFKAGE